MHHAFVGEIPSQEDFQKQLDSIQNDSDRNKLKDQYELRIALEAYENFKGAMENMRGALAQVDQTMPKEFEEKINSMRDDLAVQKKFTEQFLEQWGGSIMSRDLEIRFPDIAQLSPQELFSAFKAVVFQLSRKAKIPLQLSLPNGMNIPHGVQSYLYEKKIVNMEYRGCYGKEDGQVELVFAWEGQEKILTSDQYSCFELTSFSPFVGDLEFLEALNGVVDMKEQMEIEEGKWKKAGYIQEFPSEDEVIKALAMSHSDLPKDIENDKKVYRDDVKFMVVMEPILSEKELMDAAEKYLAEELIVNGKKGKICYESAETKAGVNDAKVPITTGVKARLVPMVSEAAGHKSKKAMLPDGTDVTVGKQNVGFFSKDQKDFITMSPGEVISYMMSYHTRTGTMPFGDSWIVTNKTLKNGKKVCVFWYSSVREIRVLVYHPEYLYDFIGGLPLAAERHPVT